MSKNKKDRSSKKFTPRNRDGLKVKFEPWRASLVFDPLEAILDQLEQEGTLTVDAEDTAIAKDPHDGKWYSTAAALQGIIEAFEIRERQSGVDGRLGPLRALTERIEKGEEIDNRDTAAARASAIHLRAIVMDMTIGEARQLVNDYNTREILERVEAAA